MSGTIAMEHGRGSVLNVSSRVHACAVKRALRLAVTCIAAGAGLALTGCASDTGQNIGDYLNLRNSFLDSSQVGRFDKANPWGKVKPVKWPILDQLDVDDEPLNRWASAVEPTPSDLVPEVKEYTLAPGDTISVGVFELLSPGAEFAQQRRVNELGYVNLQTVGPVLVSGLTPSQLEAKIAQTLIEKRILPAPDANTAGPQVNVQVLDSRQRVFSFLGTIARPGTYNVLSADFRLLDAIALAGDIPVQPGMDNLYIIRQIPFTQKGGEAAEPAPVAPANVPPPTTNPLGTLEQIEKGSQTAPAKSPAGGPQSLGDTPALLRPLPTAVVLSDAKRAGTGGSMDAALDISGTQLAAADTPAHEAVAVPPPATSAVVPAAAPAAVPATPLTPAAQPSMAGAPATKPAAASPADIKALESAVGQGAPNAGTRFVFVDGRWVPIPAQGPNTTIGPKRPGVAVPTTNEISVSAPPEKLVQQRIIRIPISALREGVGKYNIVVRPGDVINIPPVEPGEFYMMGNIARPGVYALTGRKVTLKMAVAAGGNLGALAIPRRCDLIRRVGNDQEVTVQVNLQKIFDGEQPDVFLKANDVVNIGTDAIAPFLLITRNAYRASYGWGYVYDRNIGENNNNNTNS